MDKEGIEARQVNLKVLLPYLQNVSLEKDETLQDLWANLLVNYIDIEKNLQQTVYPKILADISIEDVKVLEHIWKVSTNNIQKKDFSPMAISNLVRLGIIQPLKLRGTFLYDSNNVQKSHTTFCITEFGTDFLLALHRESDSTKSEKNSTK